MESQLYLTSFQSMLPSSKGYLYIAGGERVYLFDGKNADPLIQDFTLPFTTLNNLSEWNNSLYLISNEKLLEYGETQAMIDDQINTFQFTDQEIYYGTDQGIKVYRKNSNLIDRPDALSVLQGLKINDLMAFSESLLIATDQGLFQYDLRRDRLHNIGSTKSAIILEIAAHKEHGIWCFDDGGTIYHIDLKTKEAKSYLNKDYEFTSVSLDSTGNVWFGSSNRGILQFNHEKKTWKTINSRSGLPDDRVLKIITDSWGAVWIATADMTLSKFIDRDYDLINVYDGLPSDDVTAIYAADDLLLATGTSGVYAYGDQKFTNIQKLQVRCEAIYADSSEIWIATNGNGLIHYKDNESTVFSINAGLPSNWIQNISKDQDGSIWLATPSNGLARLNKRDSLGYTVTVYDAKNEVQDPYISAMLSIGAGQLLYGTITGKLGIIENGKHRYLNELQDINSEITDLAQDPEGNIIVSTFANGLIRISAAFTTIQKLEDFPMSIKAITFRNGQLYAANDRGVYTTEASFTVVDGFPSNHIVKSGMTVYENRIYVASNDGLISIGTLKKDQIKYVPKVFFQDVQVNFTSVVTDEGSINPTLKINYNESPVSFDFEGVNIHSGKDITYSYYLEGRDKSWSPWTRNDNPSFVDLKAGNYSFKVKARSEINAESDPISIDFKIEGPFWNKWWFIPVIVILLFLIVWLLFKYRIRQINQKNRKEKEQLKLRNRLLELEQKANQLQMNPHFIFNALNSIQATVAKENYEDARKEITDFASLMRSILSNSKAKTISLEDELKLLTKYIYVEKKCRDMDFKVQIDISEKIDSEEVMVPPMMIQPFVENAIVHGLRDITSGQLKLSFLLLNDEVMEVQVVDNGIGYDKARQLTESKHQSVAIEVTKERLEALLGKEYQPVLHIEQINDDGGTRVRLKIPVDYHY
ncbi:sensor histidine kinase [Portibacter marinus]|uniref:sensor histidine kinase n=1 Tax=Portibacter marinus TaxID=2898660 RepID=UPI001F30BF51|nr:sensor histidine kinase [Portibacter marinus]